MGAVPAGAGGRLLKERGGKKKEGDLAMGELLDELAKLAKVLQSYPLYREYRYEGPNTKKIRLVTKEN